jgi:hypothetical protein
MVPKRERKNNDESLSDKDKDDAFPSLFEDDEPSRTHLTHGHFMERVVSHL